MAEGIGRHSFQDLRQVQDSQTRYVADKAGGFRPAVEGSFLGKAMNWLKETFRPGHVKQQNVAAYTAAKDAFLAGGGNKTLAAKVFDPGIATGARFSPSDISEALLSKFSDHEMIDIFNEIKRDVIAERQETGLNLIMMNAGVGRQVSVQFLADVNRSEIIIENTPIEKDPEGVDPGSNFHDAMRAAGIGNQDIAEISKYINQRTIINFVLRLQDPEITKLAISGGTVVSPLFSQGGDKLQTFEITKNGDNFDIKFVSKEPLAVLNTVVDDGRGAKMFGNPIVLDPKSSLVISASMTVGPDKNGSMKLLSLDNAGYKLSAFSTDGSRLA